jgi:putative hydrolase of the HAD superfamily
VEKSRWVNNTAPVPSIRALLLDSGGVLVRPRGGRWNPRFDFEEVVLRHVPEVDFNRFAVAVEAGDALLSESTGTVSREEYHRAVLAVLGIDDPSSALLRELDLPLALPVFEVFPEVPATLAAARDDGVDLAVVTDNWGTSETMLRLYDQVGLGGFFDVVVVSEELGCTKPDPRMFDTAAAALARSREECLVVDDDSEIVAVAIDLGYHGAALIRRGALPTQVPTVQSLDQIFPLLD